MVHELPAGERPQRRGARKRGRDVALIATALPGRHEVADGGHSERHQPAGRHALHSPHDHELGDVLSRAAQRRSGHEEHDLNLEQPLAAVPVPELAPQRSGGGGCHHVGRHHPRHVADAAEVGRHGGQRRGQDRLVEHGRQHREHDRREREPHARSGRGLRQTGIASLLGCR